MWNLRSLIGLVVVAAAIGLAFDATGDGVSAPASDIRAPSGVFQSRAAFCPPPFAERLGRQTVAIAADPGAPAVVQLQPQQSASAELRDRALSMQRVDTRPVDAVAYGAVLHATALISMDRPATGAAAARCPRVSSQRWYFPAGSVALGYDQRIMIRNPFPDEAVVSVTFYTPTGLVAKANLREVAVPAGEARVIKLNDFILGQRVLGTAVTAQRGRIIAWGAMFAEPENRPHGVYLSLGATAASREWYFPEGAVGGGLEEVLTLLNPHQRESVVTVSLATTGGGISPPKLVEVRIPPEAIKTISLPSVLGPRDQDLGGVGAIVKSTNGVGVVAERTVWYASGRTGVASTLGAQAPATQWLVPPAAVATTEDSVVVLNPGNTKAVVRVELWRQQGSSLKPDWARLTIKPGGRGRLFVTNATGGQPVALLVTSDQPVVAERVSTSGNGDVAGVMGDPTRTEQ